MSKAYRTVSQSIWHRLSFGILAPFVVWITELDLNWMSSFVGTHISLSVRTTYSYKSKIVSNVDCLSIHLILHKSFTFHLFSSGNWASFAVVKNLSHLSELSKTEQFMAGIHHVLNWIHFASMAYNKVDRMKAATLILLIRCVLSLLSLNSFLSELVHAVVSYACPRQRLMPIVCFCKLFLIVEAMAEPVRRCCQITHVYQNLALYWVGRVSNEVNQAETHWQPFTTQRQRFLGS